jgi:ribonuclease HII
MKNFDNSFLNDRIAIIAGTDEAGRGPLAGPVVAAAVIFASDVIIEGVNDSKKLSAKTREKLFPEIKNRALTYGYDVISPEEIDEINILQASLKAMKNSVNKLTLVPDLILVDGNKVFAHPSDVLSIVKGDSKSFAIAAASIIAKVTRDAIMEKLSAEYPVYNWAQNKGYPTKEHIQAVKKYGITPYHRKTFLRKILQGGQYELGY